jgi:hypothetical protein
VSRSEKPTLIFTRDILLAGLADFVKLAKDKRTRRTLTSDPSALANFLSAYFEEAGDAEIAKAFEKAKLEWLLP